MKSAGLPWVGFPSCGYPSRERAVRVIRQVLDLGVNFIDTATGYTDSEEKIGDAIQWIPRESLVIASKSPADDRKIFLQDIYQLHNVSTRKRYEAVFAPDGAFEGLMEGIGAGKVRYPGLSSHSIPLSNRCL